MNKERASLLSFNLELYNLKNNIILMSKNNNYNVICNDATVFNVVGNCNYSLPILNNNFHIYFLKCDGKKILVPISSENGCLIEISTECDKKYLKIRTCKNVAVEYKKGKLVKYKEGKYQIIFN